MKFARSSLTRHRAGKHESTLPGQRTRKRTLQNDFRLSRARERDKVARRQDFPDTAKPCARSFCSPWARCSFSRPLHPQVSRETPFFTLTVPFVFLLDEYLREPWRLQIQRDTSAHVTLPNWYTIFLTRFGVAAWRKSMTRTIRQKWCQPCEKFDIARCVHVRRPISSPFVLVLLDWLVKLITFGKSLLSVR